MSAAVAVALCVGAGCMTGRVAMRDWRSGWRERDPWRWYTGMLLGWATVLIGAVAVVLAATALSAD